LHVKIRNEDDACHFICYQGYCLFLIHATRPNIQQSLLCGDTEAVQRKRPELWPGWFLHHDSAPAHKMLSIKQFLAQNFITEVEHTPYSPHLAPDDFWLFPEIKSALK
jgi:hypothetical protein